MKDCRFLLGDFPPNENELGSIGLERFQVPAPCDEIEQLRAIGEAHETFSPKHAGRQAVHETFETIARKNLIGIERERFEFELMLMLWSHDFFFASDAEQQIRIDPAALGADNCRGAVDFAQFRFERLDLRWLNKIDL